MSVTHRTAAASSWHTASSHVKGGWGRTLFSQHGAQLCKDGYIILTELADCLSSLDGSCTGMASILSSLACTTFDVLQAAVYKMFPGEVALQDMQSRTL